MTTALRDGLRRLVELDKQIEMFCNGGDSSSVHSSCESDLSEALSQLATANMRVDALEEEVEVLRHRAEAAEGELMRVGTSLRPRLQNHINVMRRELGEFRRCLEKRRLQFGEEEESGREFKSVSSS